MANLTIRNLDDDLKTLLRLQAARHGWSMEQEAREILRRAVQPAPVAGDIARKIHQRFATLKLDELPVPKRGTARLPAAPKD